MLNKYVEIFTYKWQNIKKTDMVLIQNKQE